MIPADFIAPVDTHNPISSGVHHEVKGKMCVCVCLFEDLYLFLIFTTCSIAW